MYKIKYEIKFTDTDRTLYKKNINQVFNKYMERNGVSLPRDRQKILMLKTIDQFEEFVTYINKLKERWNFSHEIIPVLVYSEVENTKNTLISDDNKKLNFFYKNELWYARQTDSKEGYSLCEFKSKVKEFLIPQLCTAAFYAIDSYVDVKTEIKV